MSTALKCALVEADLREDSADGGKVLGRPLVRRAANRELLRGEGEAVCSAALDDGKGLDGLRGGAPIDSAARIADAADEIARGVADRDVSVVSTFDEIAPSYVSQGFHWAACFP